MSDKPQTMHWMSWLNEVEILLEDSFPASQSMLEHAEAAYERGETPSEYVSSVRAALRRGDL